MCAPCASVRRAPTPLGGAFRCRWHSASHVRRACTCDCTVGLTGVKTRKESAMTPAAASPAAAQVPSAAGQVTIPALVQHFRFSREGAPESKPCSTASKPCSIAPPSPPSSSTSSFMPSQSPPSTQGSSLSRSQPSRPILWSTTSPRPPSLLGAATATTSAVASVGARNSASMDGAKSAGAAWPGTASCGAGSGKSGMRDLNQTGRSRSIVDRAMFYEM